MPALRVPAGDVRLIGDLTEPPASGGLVVFAHGSGSGRRSPRNRQVAGHLAAAGFGTLLFDLLTEREEVEDARSGHLRFDIPLLAGRLTRVVGWAGSQVLGASAAGSEAVPEAGSGDGPGGPAIGLFGASTGAAAALVAAAALPDQVGAVVSRGGRPDLAADALPRVRAATRLIVGARDEQVLGLNEGALARMDPAGGHDLVVVPGAGHLFEEPGALGEVSELSVEWFARHLAKSAPE